MMVLAMLAWDEFEAIDGAEKVQDEEHLAAIGLGKTQCPQHKNGR